MRDWLMVRYVPWVLLLVGSLVLYALDYDQDDDGATIAMACLIAAAGAYWLKRMRNLPPRRG
jgi:hypothetical protein